MPFKSRQAKLEYMRCYNQRRRAELLAQALLPSAVRTGFPLSGGLSATIPVWGGRDRAGAEFRSASAHPSARPTLRVLLVVRRHRLVFAGDTLHLLSEASRAALLHTNRRHRRR